MCECCGMPENHKHLHATGELSKINEVIVNLPGVLQALPSQHQEGEVVIYFDDRIISAERIRKEIAAKTA